MTIQKNITKKKVFDFVCTKTCQICVQKAQNKWHQHHQNKTLRKISQLCHQSMLEIHQIHTLGCNLVITHKNTNFCMLFCVFVVTSQHTNTHIEMQPEYIVIGINNSILGLAHNLIVPSRLTFLCFISGGGSPRTSFFLFVAFFIFQLRFFMPI